MNLLDHLQSLIPVAEDTGIALCQPFTEAQAAEFLLIPIESLNLLRTQGKIAFVRLDHNTVGYIGYQLLQYLIDQSVPVKSPNQSVPDSDRIIRAKELIDMTGLSRTTLWRMEKAGTFPTRVSLGGHSVGWKHSEVQQWLQSRETL